MCANDSVKKILSSGQNDDEVKDLIGWVRSIRDSKNLAFIDLQDGSSLNSLQLILKKKNFSEKESSDFLKNLTLQSVIKISGKINFNQKQNANELVLSSFEILKTADKDILIQKKEHTLTFLRQHSDLRTQTKLFNAIFRLRSKLYQATHLFFAQQDFIYINSPILTSIDAEGAGEQFKIEKSEEFFSSPTYLTVSGQLNVEAMALVYKNVYCFGPTFRAEKSHTTKHISEFYMLEPEMAFTDLNGIIELAYKYLKWIIKYSLDNLSDLLKVIYDYLEVDFNVYLKSLLNAKNEVISYDNAVQLINDYIKNNNAQDIPLVEPNVDLLKVHEDLLAAEIFKGPVAITNYPKEIKSFYMKANADNRTLDCFDLLVPKIGELFGGSQREDDYHKIISAFKEKNPETDPKKMEWYFNLRKNGYWMSSGFGLGFERLMMLITSISNIHDVIHFPRSHKNIKH